MQATFPTLKPAPPGYVARFTTAIGMVILFAIMADSALAADADCLDGGSETIRGYRVLADPVDHQTDSAGLIDELRSKGIRDLYGIKSGEFAGQVALGFFRQRRNADTLAGKLGKLGFRVRTVAIADQSSSKDCLQNVRPESNAGTPAPTTRQRDSESAETGSRRSESPPVANTFEAPSRRESAATDAAPDCNDVDDSWIVLADPAENGNDTLALVYQLRAKGVDQLFVVTGERHKGQVALGIYEDEAQAREREEELTTMGFRVRAERQAPLNCP